MTRGEFRAIMGPEEEYQAMVYTPKGHLKRDDGRRRGSNAALAMKRPAALPCPSEPKLDFKVCLNKH